MPETTATRSTVVDRRATEAARASSPCMAKLDRLSWSVCDWFEIAGYRFGVRSTSTSFGAWVREVLGAYRAEGPRDPDDDPLFSFVIAEPGSTDGAARKLHIFYVGTLDVVRTFDLSVAARAFLGEVEALTFPVRDDAVYVEASVLHGRGTTALIPTWMVPPLNAAGRRIRRELALDLPCALSVALDRRTGHLVPVRRTLDLPADAIDSLRRSWPSAEPDTRAFVVDDRRIDRIVVLGGEPGEIGLRPVARGPVLFDLARSIRNLGSVRGGGLAAVGRALAGAEVARAGWAHTGQLVEVVAAVLDDHVDPERTRATAEV